VMRMSKLSAQRRKVGNAAFAALRDAAFDQKPVQGWTHNFYRYPARFSPRFASTVIEHFSRPGDLVADPFMGGGTSIVEALVAGRNAIGNDLNSLAVLITKAKITHLRPDDVKSITAWARTVVPTFKYRSQVDEQHLIEETNRITNLSLLRARFIKKAIALAIGSISFLPSPDAQQFARCAVLRVAQWALDGRRRHTALNDFRLRLSTLTESMLASVTSLSQCIQAKGGSAMLLNSDASGLGKCPFFENPASRASLVVTSPPYPGVHVLYHRWQVDGRRETPAPYWIANCNDGKGASYYNFGERRRVLNDYFRIQLENFRSIRSIMRDGAYIVQLVAFRDEKEHLSHYLENMRIAGFTELRSTDRIWRRVPNRKWHASLRGNTSSAHEVVLVHRAV